MLQKLFEKVLSRAVQDQRGATPFISHKSSLTVVLTTNCYFHNALSLTQPLFSYHCNVIILSCEMIELYPEHM